ncbi:hypothetical protein CRUP_034890, partial [Coryphaenoides rupestris]
MSLSLAVLDGSEIVVGVDEEERRVRANDREYNERFQYASNCIVTSKYHVLTFLPVNLFEQFQEVANTYFLFLLILQLIPQISSLPWFTTIVPLALVLSITAVKDATDDYVSTDTGTSSRSNFRHKSDKQVNNRQSQVLIHGSVQNEKWMNVRVGDIIKLENNQFVAADLLLLSSSEPHGLCYIETAELDGLTGEVVCEPPNNKLDRFSGTLYWRECKCVLTNQNMLLRGCVLRNTEACYGLTPWLCISGPDTKLMQNSGRTKFKRTSIDCLMNTLVLWIFCFLVCMGVILAVGNAVWEKEVGSLFQSYLPWDPPVDNFLFSAFLSFWSYVIILNTVVPISLYVSVEVIRLGHSYFINWDRQMFCTECLTAAEARTTTLNEELGQVEYIFSDKTGTLTQNIMSFNKCSIHGQVYGPDTKLMQNSGRTKFKRTSIDCLMNTLVLWIFCFLVCMGVILAVGNAVWEKEVGSLFQSYLPWDPPVDNFLFSAFLSFWSYVIILNTVVPISLYSYSYTEVEPTCPSSSLRVVVRASAAVRHSFLSDTLHRVAIDDEHFAHVVRGPGNAWWNFPKPEGEEEPEEQQEEEVQEEQEEEKQQQEEEEQEEEGGRTVGQRVVLRDERLADVYEQIEQDMMLLGATAIEDKLQEGVPETIAILSLANIKIWVLTGDKQETAVNIGYSCKMLTDDMGEVFIVNGHTVQGVRQELRSAHALEADMEAELLMTACACKAVICCRVTPMQKALVVELIKKHKKAVTLAIGDGANDNFAFTMVHFWFGFFCGFSAQTVYDQYFITLYNIVYTSLPVLAMGIFDQDVPDQRSLEYPKLYEPGQLNLLFNKREFFICISQGIYTSVVLFFVPYAVLSDASQDTAEPLADYQTFAVTTATSLVIVVSVQIALDTGYWTVINHVFVWGSLGSFFTIMLAMHSQTLFSSSPNQFHFVAHRALYLQPVVWLTIALATVICIVPVLAFRFLKIDLKPQLSDTVRYTQLVRQKKRKAVGFSGAGVRGAAGSASEGRLGPRGGSRRSGYAFAHQEGFGELITSGKNMRLSSLALASFASRHSSSWIDTLRKRKHSHAHTPPPGATAAASGDSSPAPSCASGSAAPPLSNSPSALGGSQDTPIEEEEEACATPSTSHTQPPPPGALTATSESTPTWGPSSSVRTPGATTSSGSSAAGNQAGGESGGWSL